MIDTAAFQDLIPDNNCFGCGPKNEQGLRIKSRWTGEEVAECRFVPAPHHSAGPPHALNGGIIAAATEKSVFSDCQRQPVRHRRSDGRAGSEWVVRGGASAK